MKQKFRRFTKVHVCKKMPSYMSHFESDFDAIVEGTYSQLYGGTDIKSYSLYQLSNDGKKIVNNISWYEENQLTELPDQNRKPAEELIEKYNFEDEEEAPQDTKEEKNTAHNNKPCFIDLTNPNVFPHRNGIE